MSKFEKTSLMNSVGGLLTALCLVSPAFAAPVPSTANLPTGGTVVGGTASISSTTTTTTINQSTNKAIVNWSTFNIGNGYGVDFIQPSSTSVTLNRVVGSRSPSEIYGSLTANGIVMLVNANGVVFGKGSQVNVGGLIATSSDISNKNFMNGNYVFDRPGNPNASIINEGDIKIKDGGIAALVGPNVTNEGYIQANLGTVALASGDSFSLDLYGDGLINLQASDKLRKQLVENSGVIKANGGQVLMTAAAARNVVDSLINMDGLIEANSAKNLNGTVFLSGDDVTVSGTINAKGNHKNDGGTVEIAGTDKATITAKADINVSGANGGNVLMGAVGTVIDGSINAEGNAASGNGGYVATAGARNLEVSGTVKAGDKNGSAGTWQALSSNIVVTDKVSSQSQHSQISTASVDAALNNGTNVALIALGNSKRGGDVIIAGDINKTAGNDAQLALGATGNVVFVSDVSVASTFNKLSVLAGATGSESSILMKTDASISSNGGLVTFYDGAMVMDAGSSIRSGGGDIVLGAVVDGAQGNNRDVDGVSLTHASIDAQGGDITIAGHGSIDTASNSIGVSIQDGSTIKTGGAGSIEISGVGGGNLGAGGSGDDGVLVSDSTVKAYGSGSVGISGVGGGNIITGFNNLPSQAFGNIGVQINSTDVSAKSGDLLIVGIGGGNNNTASGDNDGVQIGDSMLRTGKDGSIYLVGTGGGNYAQASALNEGLSIYDSHLSVNNGTLDAYGVGGGNYSEISGFNAGVVFNESAFNVQGGVLAVTGVGGGNYAFSSGYDLGVGIYSSSADVIDGVLSVNGFGGGDHSQVAVYNYGVDLLYANVSVKNGDIVVAGAGGGNDSQLALDDAGVDIENARLGAAHSSSILLVGVGGGDQSARDVNTGIVVAGRSEIGGHNDNGQISLIADTISFSPTVDVHTKGNVLFDTYTSSTSIGIAGARGKLQLTNDLLDDIHAGSITVGDTTRDSGKITADAYDWSAPVSVLSDTGNIIIDGIQTMGSSAFLADTAQGNIVLGRRGGIISSASGDAIVLAASQGDFINNNSDPNPLNVSNSDGRWLVYSGGPVTDTFGNMAADFYRYSCSFDGNCPVIPAGGNGFLYSVTPNVTVTVNNDTVTYGQTPVYSGVVTETYSFKGKTYSLSTDVGDVTYSSVYGVATLNVGSYGIDASAGAAPSVYGFTFTPNNTGTLTVDPATLYVVADDQFKALGAPNPYLSYTYSGLEYSDTASVFTGGLSTITPNSLPGFYSITQGNLSAGGNYTIVYTPGTLQIASPLEGANAGALDRVISHAARNSNRSGTLLSIQNPGPVNNLANLSPAAGGNLSPAELANLSPHSGGGSVTPLIECNDITPCSLNQ